jgi:hypothetical protein
MNVQERIVMTEENEEEASRKRKILGIFPRKTSGSHPTPQTATHTVPGFSVEGGEPAKAGASASEYDEDVDDLPPREDDGDIGLASSDDRPSLEEENAAAAAAAAAAERAEAEALKSIPKTAGFDFHAISEVLGKDVHPEALRQPEPKLKPAARAEEEKMMVPTALERSGSAPPFNIRVEAPAATTATGVSPIMARSASFVDASSPTREEPDAMPEDNDDDEIGVASAVDSLSISNLPTWDRPAYTNISPTLPLATSSSSPTIKPPAFQGWNAWAASSSTSSVPSGLPPMRSAPPARPHPPELMANPFASNDNSDISSSGGLSASILGKWDSRRDDKDDQWATKNPW